MPGKRFRPESTYFNMFKSLQSGDVVNYEREGEVRRGLVKQVDAFKREVLVEEDDSLVTVHGRQLVMPEPGEYMKHIFIIQLCNIIIIG